MCMGIALLASELPVELIDKHHLHRRTHKRGEEPEIRFLYRDGVPLLPVIHEGQLVIVQWGNRKRKGRLPPTGWTWQGTVEAGSWLPFDAHAVEIPCNLAFEGGVWFRVRKGIKGILAHDDDGTPCAYMICLTSTRYYQVMTRAERMPLLVDEVI